MPRIRTLQIAGPAGRLEAVLTVPDGEPVAAGIVCHPHPLFGGTMQSKVVFRVSKVLVDQGLAAMRFNFRGTGASQGVHDEGRGEHDDVRAALDELEKLHPGLPLIAGGHSFGAVMALRVGVDDSRVRAMFALGFPIDLVTRTSFLDQCFKPILFVQGEHDEVGNAEKIRALVARRPKARSAVIVPGSDHLFDGKLGELEQGVSGWVAGRPWEASEKR